MVEGQLEAWLRIAGDSQEGVGRVVADGDLAGEIQAQLVRVEIYAPVQVEDPIAGVNVLPGALLRR